MRGVGGSCLFKSGTEENWETMTHSRRIPTVECRASFWAEKPGNCQTTLVTFPSCDLAFRVRRLSMEKSPLFFPFVRDSTEGLPLQRHRMKWFAGWMAGCLLRNTSDAPVNERQVEWNCGGGVCSVRRELELNLIENERILNKTWAKWAMVWNHVWTAELLFSDQNAEHVEGHFLPGFTFYLNTRWYEELQSRLDASAELTAETIKDAHMWQSKPKLYVWDSGRLSERFPSVLNEQTLAKEQTSKSMTQTVLLINMTAPSASRRRQLAAEKVTKATKGWMPPGKKNKTAVIQMYRIILDLKSCLVCSLQDFKGSFRIVWWQRPKGEILSTLLCPKRKVLKIQFENIKLKWLDEASALCFISTNWGEKKTNKEKSFLLRSFEHVVIMATTLDILNALLVFGGATLMMRKTGLTVCSKLKWVST